jgi:hypothetical protein
MFPVRPSSGTPTALSEIFRGFRQSFQANAGIVLRLGQDSFLPNRIKLIIYLYHPTGLVVYEIGGTPPDEP